MYIFNLSVTGRFCILLFFSFSRYRGIPRSFLLACPFWLVLGVYLFGIYLFFFPFRVLALLSSLWLVSSFYLHFVCFAFLFLFYFPVYINSIFWLFLFCFAILSSSVFRLLAKWIQKDITYLRRNPTSPRRPTTTIHCYLSRGSSLDG